MQLPRDLSEAIAKKYSSKSVEIIAQGLDCSQ
jgi:hypothetical protein